MNAVRMLILLPVLQLFLHACFRNEEPEMEQGCYIDISNLDFSFGIDYDDTLKYLIPGEQSDLNQIFLQEIQGALGEPEDPMAYLLKLCGWVNQNFTFEDAGGGMIGIPTVDELYALKTFYGCHSQALLVSGILRELGFPALMIETFDVGWAFDYHAGNTAGFSGHVMSEIRVGGRWILLDNDGSYVEDYHPEDPFISTRVPSRGLFVFAKGVDTWDYSHKNESFTHEKLLFFSENIYCFGEMFNTTDYHWKP